MMAKKASGFFQHMDRFLFKKMDTLKGHALYQKYAEKISTLKLGPSIIFLLLPLIPLLFFFFSNLSLKNTMAAKRDILEQAALYRSHKGHLSSSSSSRQGSFSHIKDKKGLQKKILELLKLRKIPSGDVVITDFQGLSPTESTSTVKAKISFGNFTMEHLTSFLSLLLLEEKLKASFLSLEKHPEKDQLSGRINITQYGKAKAKAKFNGKSKGKAL